MAGTLYVVATPIGNLEDITLRALRVLKEVDLVAAEDTRHSGNLLRHYGISTPLISVHEHNEHARSEPLIRRLLDGQSIALVSDAGTPGISDPGAHLVRAARTAGLKVEPIPGPSAVTAILSATGFAFDRFMFAGFPPIRSKDRTAWFEWVDDAADVPVVCFEAPHRIGRTLDEMSRVLAKRPIVLARELTKLHEEWRYGELGTPLSQDLAHRGEFVIVLGPSDISSEAKIDVEDATVASTFGQITKNGGVTRREAVRAVGRRLGLSPRAVYAALERTKADAASATANERQ